MIFEAMLFYLFATVTVGAALGVVFSRNPVHSVMFLVLTFFNSAILWLMAEAEFLAIVLVLVYAIAIALIMVIELIQLIWLRSRDVQISSSFAPTPEGYDNTKALGAVLYTEHVYAFEIAAVILLLAIVAAITLTMRKRPGLKVQDIVKMDAEKKQ